MKIPDHFRNSAGLSRLSVCATNDSIHDANFLRGGSFVVAGVVSEPVRVRSCIIITFVPTDLAVVGDSERAAIAKGDGLDEVGHEAGDDGGFEVGGVHEGEGVVIMEHDDAIVLSPDVKHGAIDDLGEGFLGIIGDGRTDGIGFGAPAHEPSLAATKGG